MKEIIKKYIKMFIANKYFVVIVIFVSWMAFFDANNLIDRLGYDQKIHELNQEINFYQKEIEQSERKMSELKSDNENLEKFAREQFLMKRQNEDIFIINE